MKVINKIKNVKQSIGLGFAYFRLVQDPNDTIRVFNLENFLNGAATAEGRQKAIEFLKETPAIKQMMAEHYLAPSYKVEDLAGYQPGTLGYAYYRHMHDNNFDPNFFPAVELNDDLDYLALRLRQTHDLWHVLTGYGPSKEDEIGLQAFYAAQMPIPVFASALMSAGLLHNTIFNQKMIKPMINAITQGWQMGSRAKHIHAAKWETMWDRPLAEIRHEYNIIPASDRFDFTPSETVAETEKVLVAR